MVILQGRCIGRVMRLTDELGRSEQLPALLARAQVTTQPEVDDLQAVAVVVEQHEVFRLKSAEHFSGAASLLSESVTPTRCGPST